MRVCSMISCAIGCAIVVLAAAPAMAESIWWQEYTTDTNTVVLWHLNETTGATADDASSNSNDATLNNMGDNDWVAGKFGNALYFGQELTPPSYNTDEDGRKTDNSSFDFTDKVTVEAWINPDKQNSSTYYENSIASKGSEYILAMTNAGALGASVLVGGTSWLVSQSADGIISEDEWTHVAMTYDKGDGFVKLYLNGVEVSSYARQDTGGGAWADQTTDAYLANSHTGNTRYFDGRIDEVRISNTVREFAIIPEPASVVLLGTGLLAGLLLLAVRRRVGRS